MQMQTTPNVASVTRSRTEDAPAPVADASDSGPRVSVLVPCYNTAGYVGETLESLWSQSYSDFEVVVVNDGSPDTPELEAILEAVEEPYRSRIVYIAQENRGLSGARNTALRAARGEFVALLDSDDYWHPRYLEVLVGELDRRGELDVIFPDAMIFGDAPEAGKTMMQTTPLRGEITFGRLLAQECFVFVGVVARKCAVVDAGLFDESFRSSEDFELWLRILRRGGRIGYTREVLAYYRRRADSLSANIDRMFQHHLMVWDKVEATMKLSADEMIILETQRSRTRAKQKLEHARRAFLAGEFDSARLDLKSANSLMRSPKLSLIGLAMLAAPRVLLASYRMRERLSLRTNTH